MVAFTGVNGDRLGSAGRDRIFGEDLLDPPERLLGGGLRQSACRAGVGPEHERRRPPSSGAVGLKFFPRGWTIRVERDRDFADSPLEEAGFEPLVPRKTPAVVVISGLVAPPSPLRQSRADTSPSLESLVVSRRY